jgi:hypothetical protein
MVGDPRPHPRDGFVDPDRNSMRVGAPPANSKGTRKVTAERSV